MRAMLCTDQTHRLIVSSVTLCMPKPHGIRPQSYLVWVVPFPFIYTCLIDATGQASLPCWSAALSRALCFIHKQHPTSTAGAGGSKPRILCITGSPDVPAQYIATMNAIFSAQVYAQQDITVMYAKATLAHEISINDGALRFTDIVW